MNFREWLALEIIDIANFDASELKITRSGSGHKISFTQNGQYFTIWFAETNIEFQGNYIPDCYEISFKGPSDYDLTGTSGNSASAVYTKLLAGIAKFLEEEAPVNGLSFSGNEPVMDLIYNRFYKQYLQKEFLRINSKEYISKKYLKKNLQNSSSKQNAYKNIISANRVHVNFLNDIKQNKSKRRNNYLSLKKFEGRFVFSRNLGGESINYVFGKTSTALSVIKMLRTGVFVVTTLGLNQISDALPTNEQIHNFLLRLKETPYSDYVDSAVYSQYGIQFEAL